MTVVLDTSVVAAWALPDETYSAVAAALARQFDRESSIAPNIFWYEIRHVLVRAERDGRIDEGEAGRFIDRVAALIEIDAGHNELALLGLARAHRLSVYDAAYLETALRRAGDLATFDRELASAARAEGVGNPAEQALGHEV